MELNGEMRRERCDGKAWTQTWVSAQRCWPDLSPQCSRGSGHEKFLGNFLQTYFVFLLSGTVESAEVQANSLHSGVRGPLLL